MILLCEVEGATDLACHYHHTRTIHHTNGPSIIEGIEPEMRFSPVKIVEGKCASKYCEVISAEELPDLSDARKSPSFVIAEALCGSGNDK